MSEHAATGAMTRKIERQETRKVKWWAVEGPRACQCGHDHFGRAEFVNNERTRLAPQWGFCEDPTCSCDCLRAVRMAADLRAALDLPDTDQGTR